MKLYSVIHISIFLLVALTVNNNHHHQSMVNAVEDTIQGFVSDLLTDEIFMQCFLDTAQLMVDNRELEMAGRSFDRSVEFSQVTFTNDMARIGMVYSQEIKEEYRDACEAAGGHFDEMDGSIDGFECDKSTATINTAATENSTNAGTAFFDTFENGTENGTGSGTASVPLSPLPPPVSLPNPSIGSDNSSLVSSSSSGASAAAVEATKAESKSGAALASTSLAGITCLGFFVF
uniref:Uncharacterized protein n=1 Tax=Pseudo-nitzschia australis TaxID=44445 RepID=A0A7S4AGY5_9STRA|mmetsp:Transcript_8166/g.17617  ORF Transcript_8166/g.17617 Transcript_8166/m.17617 type:complete len:233 (-) Transcript_8166:227-925(-)|eukprot:CAMPEP_0168166666 /NCGR_PEP_ID=MMETSP0139_2-20121125/2150_1 /TAXON_ID=44445 /ORGANISM="Pseudo-nitzschia australis, Strain 10249 10 AB" /LENGTH=232 /DNA_ID=CAMNT_0008083881 /DNA_START=457 /DNA_END=1155 /DNA_ORIENTATION=-